MTALSGIRILVTRSREQAPALIKPLMELGAHIIAVPTIEIVPPQSWQPLDKALIKIQSYDWLVLTSVNGVRFLEKRMEKAEMAPGLLRRMQIAAIGPATRAEIEKLGLKVAVTPAEYVAEAVVAELAPLVKNKKVLLVRAKVARDVIPQQLREFGAEVDVAEAYQTDIPIHAKERLNLVFQEPSARPQVITFTSSSTVKNLVTLLGPGQSPKEKLQGILLASIGPVTTATLRENGLEAHIEAREYTIPGLVAAIAAHFATALEQ
jgi:uroporphyrinogen-III synthase